MYIVKIKNGAIETPIHDEREKLNSGKVVKGINTIDSFTFSMLPANKGFNLINEFQTLITVYNTKKKRYDFIGRVLHPEPSMSQDGLIEKAITCESVFGYLCDSQQPYVATQNWTVRGLFQHLINNHNSQMEAYKHFAVGEVTVTDPNDNLYLAIQRENTWEAIRKNLIDKLGGELRYRVVGDAIYIDYLEKIGETRATPIELSVNMKAITMEKDPTSYVTRLIPLGAKLSEDTEERLDITSVNGGKNYIDDIDAIAAYGIHVGYVTFDDVTLASNLLRKGQAWMAENNRVQIKYSITHLDLSLIGLAIDDMDVGDYHPIKNPLLGIDDTARIIKKSIDICEEVKSTIEMGDNFKTLNDIQQEQSKQLEEAAKNWQTIQSTTNNLKDQVSSTQKDLESLQNKVEGAAGLYFYIKYSAYSDGHIMTDVPDENTLYIGTCSTSEETAPTDNTKYTWCRIKGEQGEQGEQGETGASGEAQYLHIKYSDDGETFTANDGEDLGAWIGTLVDFNEEDSTTFSDYTWKKFTEDVDDELEYLDQRITEESTTILEDVDKILMSALETYVQTSNYEQFQKTVESQMKLVKDSFTLRFEETEKKISNVDGDLQSKFNQIATIFEFTINGFTIGKKGSPYKIFLDDNEFAMSVNGVRVLWFELTENSHEANIPELNVTSKFNLFNFLIEQDRYGNVNCEYVGGD